MKARHRLFKIFSWFAILAISSSQAGWADNGQLMALIRDMQNQMAEMQKTIQWQSEKIRDFEKQKPEKVILPEPAGDFKENLKASIGDADKWLKDLKFSADFRLRYEAFDFSSGHPLANNNRNRFRFRLRYGFEKKFNPDMVVGFGLASGGTADPTSTNETFTGNFVYKTHVIERAYGIYTPSWAKAGPVEKLELGAGKVKNPFERGNSEIIWDRDVRPEGAYQAIDLNLFKSEDLSLKAYAATGQFILRESDTATDAQLFAYQFGLNPEINTGLFEKPVKLNNAISYYHYRDYATGGAFGAFARGNPNFAFPASELDAGAFKVLSVYNEIGFQPQGLPSLKLFYDWATNLAEDAPMGSWGGKNNAWALGLKIGEAKKKGQWEAKYEYRWIDPNSVPGVFNDSDFGLAHSNKRGSVFKGTYKLTDNLDLGAAAFFVNNVAVNDTTAHFIDQEQRRFQVDLAWKF